MAKIEKVGIVGAGRMGCGIAQVFALAGFNVRLNDQDPVHLDAAKTVIGDSLDRQIKKKHVKPGNKDKALKRIQISNSLKSFKDCDLVIEAIAEDEEAKCTLWRGIVSSLRQNVILASNTSSISITRLAAASGRAPKFVGMHFMNPAPAMDLVELIRGIATDEETIAACRELITKIGKTPVMAEDFPAFTVNRVLLTMVNEAIYTLYEGVGSVESIDSAMRLGANHPMGPLELADFIGLDICLHIINVLHEGLADSKYRPCPLLVKYVEAGWLGCKTGRGFYDYSGNQPVPTR